MSEFKAAIEWVLENEGGYSNHPSDPGGKTNYGITNALAKRHGFDSARDVTRDDALKIYKGEFWHPRFGEVSQPIATKTLDLCVHFGPNNGVRIAQQALNVLKTGWVDVDGWFGNNTVHALNMLADGRSQPPDFCSEYWWLRAASACQAERYARQAMGNLQKLDFIYGWLDRAARKI
jgi:lysozyme family protein